MTAIVTRTPLHNLSMTGAQTNGIKRKSLRHAQDPDEDAPPAKKSKAPPSAATKNASQNTLKKTRSKKGEFVSFAQVDAQLLMRARPAYDEDDDGFNYTRTRSRKAKAKTPEAVADPDASAGAAPAPEVQPVQEQPPPTDENAPPEPAQPPRKKIRKTLPTTPEHPAPRRRSKRLSGNSPVGEQAASTSQSAPAPTEPQPQAAKLSTPPPAPTIDQDAPVNGSPAVDQGELTIHKKRGPAKIPLPFGETPVLRRNKEMRKLSSEKSRRSSSGMRGRRASSLIEAGSSRGTWILFPFPSSIFSVL